MQVTELGNKNIWILFSNENMYKKKRKERRKSIGTLSYFRYSYLKFFLLLFFFSFL